MGLKKAKILGQNVFALLVLVASGAGVGANAASYEPLSEAKLTALMQKHCTLVLPWASWCPYCIEELPVILPALNTRRNINPVVLDLSRPYVQEQFSRKFMEKLDLKYPTYRLPMESKEEAYQRLIDSSWKGALPSAFLFTCVKGKCALRKRWNRKISPETLDEMTEICK